MLKRARESRTWQLLLVTKAKLECHTQQAVEELKKIYQKLSTDIKFKTYGDDEVSDERRTEPKRNQGFCAQCSCKPGCISCSSAHHLKNRMLELTVT